MMTIPRMTIVLFFLFGMLTGCGTPLIDISVDVHSGVQPGVGLPPGSGGCDPDIPWWACFGGATLNSGVLKKISDTDIDMVKVYEIEVNGQIRKLSYSVPPDKVEDDLKPEDQVIFSFGTPKSLGTPK